MALSRTTHSTPAFAASSQNGAVFVGLATTSEIRCGT
jgi:hypothetical protein